jgi:hypothetical protein
MKRSTSYLLALAVGVLLAIVATYLAGFVAAVPIQRVSAHFRHDHHQLFLLLLDIVGAVPLGILAWIVGRILFDVIGASSPLLWIVAALPWAVFVVAGAVDYIRSSGYSFRSALSVILGWPSLPGLLIGVLPIPVGLWCASRAGHWRNIVAP